MLFISVGILFVAAIANAAVFGTYSLHNGPIHYVDGQCRNLNDTHNVSLEVCMQICKEEPGCNAFNFKENSTSHCDLLSCESPEEFPNGSIWDFPNENEFIWDFPKGNGYQAYTRIIDIHDCFDSHEDCPRKALLGECGRNSTFVSSCKRSCEECKCPDGFFNSRGSLQCFKYIEDVNLNWDDSKNLCQDMGLRIPEYIGGDLPRLLQNDGYDFWLNGRGEGGNMVLQNSQNVLKNVSCDCSFSEHCKTFIGTNQCLTTSYKPIHCLHTRLLLCEENLEALVTVTAPAPAAAPAAAPASTPTTAPAPTPFDNCHNKWWDWICQGYADLGHCTNRWVIKNCEKACDKCPMFKDCPYGHGIWNECKRGCWDPACSTVCRHGTQCCKRNGSCQMSCGLPSSAVASCSQGFQFDFGKHKCVRRWRNRVVV